MPTNPSDEPAAQAHALLERLFALLRDCPPWSPRRGGEHRPRAGERSGRV